MTNDEDRTTKEVRNTNDELPDTRSGRKTSRFVIRSFVIPFVLRHSDFVIDVECWLLQRLTESPRCS